MDLLIFFAIPIAVIILSAVLERSVNCPTIVAAITFAILLIVTFAAFDINFLVVTIIYTIISYITALLVKFICCLLGNSTQCSNNCGCNNILDPRPIAPRLIESRPINTETINQTFANEGGNLMNNIRPNSYGYRRRRI